jgi:hypothetical protein
VDALGYYMAPWSYAQLQVLQQAVVATESLDDAQLGDYIRANTFKTVLGDVRFGSNGELAQSRVLQSQFRNVKTNDLAQFKDISIQVVFTTQVGKRCTREGEVNALGSTASHERPNGMDRTVSFDDLVGAG